MAYIYCGLKYVGSTCRKLHTRILEHKSRIRNAVKEVPLMKHFLELKHGPEDFNFFVLEEIVQKSRLRVDLHKLLLQREMFWIFQLHTIAPRGLNVGIHYAVFL